MNNLAMICPHSIKSCQGGGPHIGLTMVHLLRAGPWLAFALIGGSATPVLAASCKSSGGLAYLGNTRDASRSIWLSRTQQGLFALESAQGN